MTVIICSKLFFSSPFVGAEIIRDDGHTDVEFRQRPIFSKIKVLKGKKPLICSSWNVFLNVSVRAFFF